MQAAADGAGVTVAQLTKMVESGTVLAEDLPGMATQLQKLYGTGAQVQGYAASWNGLVSAITEGVLAALPKSPLLPISRRARYSGLPRSCRRSEQPRRM